MRKKISNSAFSLVEVTMALGLMSFCMVAMLGMLPVGMSQERKSTDQLLTLQALTAVSSDLKNAPVGSSETSKYLIPLPAVNGGSKSGVLSLDANLNSPPPIDGKQFSVAYQVDPPSSDFSSYRIWLRVYRSSRADPTIDPKADYTESVILKPAF